MAFIDGMTDRWLKKQRPFQNLKNDDSANNGHCTDANEDHKFIRPPRELFEILVQQARNVQLLPDVAVRAIAVAEDPDANIRELVGIIGQDVMLTTRIISLSNSVLYGAGQPNAGLHAAIMRLGFRQTKNMILAACFTRMQKDMDWKEVHTRDQLCKHSFMTGVICTRLNKLFNLGMQGEEFTAGLIHDVGRTLLAVAIPVVFEQMDGLNFEEYDRLLENELQQIGSTHSEIGAWFLQRNLVPAELVNAARYHHNPRDSNLFKRLVTLVAIADDLSNFAARKPVVAYECLNPDCMALMESLGVEDASRIVAENWKQIIESATEEATELLSL